MNVLAGVPADFPPQYSIDTKTGQPVGFAIDIMDELTKKIGLTVQYKVFDTWPEAILALKEKRIHLIPNIGIISERKSDFDFTIPVETFHISLFIRNTTIDIRDVSDLTDRIVAVVNLNKGLFIMKEQEGVKLQIHNSLEQALLSLLSGNADAFVYPGPPVKLILLRSGIEDRIKIVGKPLMEIKRGIAVQKGFITLQEKLNDVIRDFVGTPGYKKIYAKWYGKPKPFWNIKKVIIAMGILLALTILCLIVWHYLSIIHLNKALNENEQKFRTVADFAYDWEFWVRPDCSHIYASPSCKRITGYGPDDFINNPGLMMEIIHPDDKAIFTKHRHIVDESGEIFPIEFRIIAKDGDERWIEHVCQAVYDKDGQHFGQRGSNRDITEQKKLQEQVLKARKLESLGTLAGGIAHDLNNLLYVVMGNISLAQDDLKPEIGTSESLKEAEQACMKAKKLSARLITFSKGGDPVKKITSMGDLLKAIVASALSGSDIKPEISISDDIRQVNIDGPSNLLIRLYYMSQNHCQKPFFHIPVNIFILI